MAVTGASAIADSAIAMMQKAFYISASDNIVIDQLASYKFQEKAKAVDFVKFTKLDKATSALTDNGLDATAEAVADTKVTLTPLEYGNVVTVTSLATLHSGGKIDLAVPKLIGTNMAESINSLGLARLNASADSDITDYYSAEAGSAGTYNTTEADSDLAAGDIINYNMLQAAHNKLISNNIQPFNGGYYALVVHPHVAGDIVKMTEFKDYNKYTSQDRLFRNEIGALSGFRIITSTGAPIGTDTGTSNVDGYHSMAMGQNALGKAVSLEPELRITGPFDNLGRAYNLGWYGCFQYDVIDGNALVRLNTSSSYGAN